jgi:hypothetical protein
MARITEARLLKELDHKFPKATAINPRRAAWIVTRFGNLDGKVNGEKIPEYLAKYNGGKVWDSEGTVVPTNCPVAKEVESVGNDATWWLP